MNSPGDRSSADATASPARRRPGLTRDQVLSAVMAIIDEGGVEELTMRRLAKALDRNPMAIYRTPWTRTPCSMVLSNSSSPTSW